jgi:hypothetical protein
MAESAADACTVAPHHLGEVAPRGIVVRVVVRVLGLLLVPAMSSGPSELDPSVVAIRRRVHGGEVAAGAFLSSLALRFVLLLCRSTYMFGVVGALLDVFPRLVGKVGVPNQVLGAVNMAPVPMGPHHSVNEIRVVLVGSGIVNQSAALDTVGRSSDCTGRGKSDEGGDNLHNVVWRR